MVRSLLVLRFSSVGDVVLTSGAVTALAKANPGARVVYATKHAFVDLMRHHPAVSEVIGLAPKESASSLLRRLAPLGPFDGVIDLHGKLRSRFVSLRTSARRKVVWEKRSVADTLFVPMRLRRYQAAMPIAARYHGAVERFAETSLPREPLTYVVGESAMASARDKLAGVGNYIVMSPGALWATKQWPTERFGALAAKADAQVVLTGSASEKVLSASVRAIARNAIDLCGALSLAELGGVIAGARAVVANDSGPMHMARALGVPTLAFFGSTDPAQFRF
ncbi:MAG: glycosyltransferase family 9 protein, partial [Clostridia bacterium]|nr:glycosyltransferase family 9 protein [Deltaproteobacteria bacterium]